MKYTHVQPSEPFETPFLWRVRMMKYHWKRHFQHLRGNPAMAKYHKQQAMALQQSLANDKRNFTNTIFQDP